LSRELLKNQFMGVQNDQKSRFSGHKKNRRFVIFSVRFCPILSENCPIRIYRKTGPTKSTVLGPRPPPWEFHKFYRILSIFRDFGVFNRAGKTVSKIGIYSKPPPKSRFYVVFINSRPNFFPIPFIWSLPNFNDGLLFDHYPFQNWFANGPNVCLWGRKTQQFFFFVASLQWSIEERTTKRKHRRPPKRGIYRRKSRRRQYFTTQFRSVDHIWSLPIGSGADIGPRYSLYTSPSADINNSRLISSSISSFQTSCF
jgi:hypothetical protein